jgi:serine protease AprX
MLMSEAAPFKTASARCQGAGAVDVVASARTAVPSASSVSQGHPPSTGIGSLDASRGSDRITADGVVLEGEQDIMGNQWIGYNEIVTSCVKEEDNKTANSEPTGDTSTERVALESVTLEPVKIDPVTLEPVKIDPVTLEPVKIDPVTLEPVSTPEIDAAETTNDCSDQLQPTKTLWNGGDWNGATWSGASWSGASWSGATWSGASWSGASWSGATWSGASWSGASWSGATWSGASWSGLGWLGLSWH